MHLRITLEAELTRPGDRLDRVGEGIESRRINSQVFDLSCKEDGGNGREVVGRTKSPIVDIKSEMLVRHPRERTEFGI